MDKNNEEENNPLNVQKQISFPDIYLEYFLNSITESTILKLYSKLKLYESKGYITHDKYLESMKETFDDPIKEQIQKNYDEENNEFDNLTNISIDMKNIEETINEIYELYFLRFREIKCILKNNKTVFYLTDFKPENYINSYNVICSITIFLKSCFENKIKLLFKFTDIDEDGFLNESEIRQMITTCNFLFCEEGNFINTNSSILAQSLTNHKVNDILKEILYEPGRLYPILEEEKYINFDVLYKSIKLIKDYKYRIIPFYINLKQCLNNVKKEKIIQINDKHKYDFIKISSSLFSNKAIGGHKNMKNQKSISCPYINSIIKPKRITKDNETINRIELPNISKSFFTKRSNDLKYTNKSVYINYNKKDLNEKSSKTNIIFNYKSRNHPFYKNKLIVKKAKTFKDLLRETTIIEMKDEKTNETNKNFNKNSYYNYDNREVKYFFEANYDKIKNIEVEPGLIKFINNDHFNNTNIGNVSTHNINNINKQNIEKKKKNSEKNVSFIFNKDKSLDNYIVQEEKTSEDQENKSKTSNDERKKMKKIKIMNFSDNIEKNKNIQPVNTNILNNLYKTNNAFRNQSIRPTLRKRTQTNKENFQKNKLNSTLIDGRRYKTLDEVFHEINVQENKFNSDSYGGFGVNLMNGFEMIKEQQKNIKKLLGECDKKDLSMAFHKSFLNKCKKLKKQKNRNKSIN